MTYNKFVDGYLKKGLIKKQKTDFKAIEPLIIRAFKDLKAAQSKSNYR